MFKGLNVRQVRHFSIKISYGHLAAIRKEFEIRTGRHDILNRVKLHLPGLIGTASHPDMQKVRKIGFFFEKTTLAV